ncbi:MAG: GTPase HflX [Bacteriovoracaceae bacterium]
MDIIDQFNLPQKPIAVLVSICSQSFEGHTTMAESEASLQELQELLRTLNVECLKSFIQNKREIDPAFILGKGKIEEIAEFAKNSGANLLVFDFELSASQGRNIQKITKLKVIDRVNVILEIFASHARTKEAQIQIEISKLEYMLPRLTSLWSHFSRQRGGVGVRGGEGEQQLELDRRIIKDKISFFKKQLKDIAVSRQEQSKQRKNKAIVSALVGYTNAGKSSLMNRLCRVNVLAEDKLFATLDSTFRMLNPDTKPPMILIDTVGFISNLPNTLINGFRSTLDSASEADLLIIVVDLSNPQYEKHLQVTHDVLKELKIEKKDSIIVFNKVDLVQDEALKKVVQKKYPNSFLVSTMDEKSMQMLRSFIIEHFLKQQKHYDLFVPYDQGEVHSTISAKTNVISTHNYDKGIFYRIRIPEFIFNSNALNKFILAPEDPLLKRFRSEIDRN